MNNLAFLKNFLSRGGSPQQFLGQIPINNPMLVNLIKLAKKGDTQSIETFARNLFNEQGRDFDKEFNEFKKSIK